jgi:FkbM family methyltransferase
MPIDIAQGRPATQSSTCGWSTFPNAELEAAIVNCRMVDPQRFCHTGWEPRPWWQVEFDGCFDLDHVRIHNRVGLEQRLKRFSLLGSLEGEIWRELFRKSDDDEFRVFDARIAEPIPVRWLRLRSDGVGYLHVSGCEAFGKPANPKRAEELRAQDAETAERRRRPPEGKTGHIAIVGGFNVFVDDAYTKVARDNIDGGDYELRERAAVLRQLRPSDRVLELGAGIGAVAMTAAAIVGASQVVTFDANPAMIAAARDNFTRNGLEQIRAEVGALVNRSRFKSGATVRLHVAGDFWGSRLDASRQTGDIVSTIETPVRCLEDEIRRHAANVITCDIEGGETDLFDGADLAAIRLIVMETHYHHAGEAATNAMIRNLILQGFAIDLEESVQQVVILRR